MAITEKLNYANVCDGGIPHADWCTRDSENNHHWYLALLQNIMWGFITHNHEEWYLSSLFWTTVPEAPGPKCRVRHQQKDNNQSILGWGRHDCCKLLAFRTYKNI
jgi:hypothetical protein